MRNLTTYDPLHASSSSSSDAQNGQETKHKSNPKYKQIISLRDMALDDRDAALLRVIVKTTDSKDQDENTTKTDFHDLYDAFESYVRANGVANHSQCFSILVKLCGYHEETWAQRLEHCFQDYSLAEYAEYRDADLNQRLSYYNLLVKKGILDMWAYKTERNSLNQDEMETIAEQKDNKALTGSVLSLWVRTMNMQLQRENEADRHYSQTIKRKYLRQRMLSQMHKNKSLRSSMISFVYSKFLGQWQRRSHGLHEHTQLADQILSKNAKSDALTSWAYASLEARVDKQLSRLVLGNVLNTWETNTGVSIEMEQQAEEKDRMVTNQHTLNKWRARMQMVNTDSDVADEMMRENLVRRMLGSWRRAAQVNIQGKSFEQKQQRKVLSRYLLDIWRLRTQQSRESTRFRHFMLKLHAFKQWRLETGCQVVIKRTNYRIAERRYKDWVLSERLCMFTRYRDALTMLKVLYDWKYKRACLTRDLNKRERSLKAKRDRGLQSLVFSNWLETSLAIQTAGNTADGMYQETLKTACFSQLFKTIARINDNHAAAAEMEYHNRTGKILHSWNNKAQVRKDTRLSALLEQYTADQEFRLKTQAMEVWVNGSLDLAHLRQTADSMYESTVRSHAYQKQFRTKWYGKLKEIQRQRSRADAIYEDRVLSGALTRWINRRAEIRQLQEDELFMTDIANMQLQGRVLRQWRMRMFRINSRQRDADMYLERLRRERFKQTWRTWVAKAHEHSSSSDTLADSATASTNIGPNANGYNNSNNDHTATPYPDLIETPSRVMSRKKIGLASVDRWRQLRSTPKRTAHGDMASPPQTARPATPVRKGSSLRNELFNTP